MANKLIHYNNKLNFELDKDSITEHSIVFILDSKEISTHGTIYKSVNWSVLGDTITFTITSNRGTVVCRANKGSTWEEWINSEYSKNLYLLDNTGNALSINFEYSGEYIQMIIVNTDFINYIFLNSDNYLYVYKSDYIIENYEYYTFFSLEI